LLYDTAYKIYLYALSYIDALFVLTYKLCSQDPQYMQQIARSSPQVGAALRRQRKLLRLSQEQVGAKTKLRQATISSLESGEPGTKLATLFDVLAALDLELVIRSRTKGRVGDIEDIF